MGFSSALQGRAAHEALLVRQDAELRLLDTMKRCLSQKVKCDKEYAIALAAVSQQGLKIDRGDDLQGSLITRGWRAIMEEWEQSAKQIKSNAELLESVCQDKLTHLYQDKRKARKAYQEEHGKIAAQFTNLTEEVAKKKVDYQKHLEYYKLLRTRFEEHYIKAGRGGRKLDDVRDKYQKACRKLHLAHNEYVLLISEANEVETDFRTILLPGLLEHQQTLQEGFITSWKNILNDALHHSDLTSDKFQEIQRRIESNLKNVNPAEEYREFTEKHKTSPAAPILFQFDQTLIEDKDKDKLGNKLQPNALTVDNLTVDWLRSRLNDLETTIKDCQEKQIKLITDNGTGVGPATTPSGSPILNGVNGTGKEVNKHSKDLNTMRCQERQMLKLADMIKTALNDVGCEELPSGCDDLSVDQSFIENNVSSDQPDAQNNSSYILQKGAVVMSMIKAPFKRKSAPVSSNRSTISAPSLSPKGTPTSMRGRSISLGSSVNSLEMINYCRSSIVDGDDNEQLIENDNIYAEIDVNNSDLCEINKININTNTASRTDDEKNIENGTNNDDTDEKVELRFSLKSERGCNNSNSSKNNLLEMEDSEQSLMWTSLNVHLDNIDKVNRSLDKKILKKQTSELNVEELPKNDEVNRSSFREIIKSRFTITKCDPNVKENLEFKRLLRENSNKIFDKIDNNLNEVENREQSVKKKIKSKGHKLNNKSMNALMTSIKDFKNSRKKSIEENFDLKNISFTDKNEIFEKFSNQSTKHYTANEDEKNLLPCSSASLKSGKFRKFPSKSSKLKQNIKSKLKFNIKLSATKSVSISNSTAAKATCRRCAKKQSQKIYPQLEQQLSNSRKMLNFVGKELNKNLKFRDVDNADFCVCPLNNSDNENNIAVLSINKDLSGMTLATNRPLYEEEWFHGVLPREEVVRLLKNEGDFLVRETIRNEESQIVLSVCWNGHKHFIVQLTVEGHYRFEGPAFPSIQELIMHQHLSEAPVTGRSGAVLKKPVLRERWELSNDDVILQDKIGRGNFGDVYKARLKSSKKQVAVKTCRMTLPDEQKRKFLQEGRILKQYDHPNIVKLIGICVQKQPIMIVMELVPGGSLLNFLRKNATTLNTKQLMCMCRDAAAGMRYLESKNCIHRDLAARNCLIGYENIVKISDFGMSREEEEYIVSDGMKQIPIKWTAPEALNFGKYTSLCDVWSYGILMWEIFSKGDTPYTGMSNSRARERIDAGYRMPASDNTPQEMYRLMLKCWAYEPEARPHFDEINTVVEALIARE